MHIKQQFSFAALGRSWVFGKTHAPEPEDPRYTAHLTSLEGSILRAETLGTRQEAESGLSRGTTRAQRAARKQLRNRHMTPLRQIAKTRLVGVEGMEEQFRLPHPKAPTEKLLSVARGMASLAETHAETFIQAGEPADFLDQLKAAIAKVEATIEVRGTSRGSFSGATAALVEELKKGRAVVSLLDAMIRRRYDGDVDTLTAWRSAKRISPVRRSAAAPLALSSSSATPEVVHQAA